MSFRLRALTRALFGLALALSLSPAFAQDNDEAADEGRALYTANQCWQCHGYEGQGGPGPRIAPTLYPFAAFAAFVRHPNLMPAYSPNVLSDEQLRQIFEYVSNVPEPPAVEDIPELSGS